MIRWSLLWSVVVTLLCPRAFGQFGLGLGIDPRDPLDTDRVTVAVNGYLPDTCYSFGGGSGHWMGEIEYRIDLNIGFNGSEPCLTVIIPFQQSFDLGALPAGHYRVTTVAFVPETGSSESAENTFHVWSEPAETIVVELPEVAGFYETGTERSCQVDLGVSLFEIDSAGIEWTGWIAMGTGECFPGGEIHGVGGEFLASFHDSSARASHREWELCTGCQVPFDGTDAFSLSSGDSFAFLLDGAAILRVLFWEVPWSECIIIPPFFPSGSLHEARLLITGRRMHDLVGDGDVDLDDAAEFAECLAGPGVALGLGCRLFDQNRDDDVDLGDAASLQREFMGP